jgi:hypothetical protein
MFSNHVYKIIILPTLVTRIPNLEIFLFCQHNSTGGGNLELRQTTAGCKKNGNCQNKIDTFLQFFHSVKPSYGR